MARAKRTTAFPVGLYGMLLFALAWLTLPRLFAPLERVLVGAACSVPRCTATWFGEPAVAADRSDLRRIEELGERLLRRVGEHDLTGAGDAMPLGDQPLMCRVLSVDRRGGGGLPSELRLDRSYAELYGCRELVTKGGALLGYLLRPGIGRAVDDLPGDPARVMLCHHRDAPRCYAMAVDPDGGPPLRIVVRPAASVDPAPLSVDMWDDPFRASRLHAAGYEVRTLPLAFGARRVPGGLLLGRTRIWGYEPDGVDEPLTIGVYVVPPVLPQALSHVVVWRPSGVEAPSAAASHGAHSRSAARLYDLPGVGHGRHLLVAERAVPDDAAVIQDGLFLGTARGLSFGTGLVTAFVATRQPWSLLLLPDGDDAEPIELYGRVEQGDGDRAWLRLVDGPDGRPTRLVSGYLFTGSNGRHCPAGLWIGRAQPDQFERDLLEVKVPALSGASVAEVFVEEAAR
ncbi:MAG: hypothetical protein H6835_18835 [Planctomycetes bacterium]|nr:hypothetical protein [Planctomycetota bacterium]